MKPPVKLPRKMSALIRLALADLAKVERSTRYTVDMDLAFHMPFTNDKGQFRCSVCFAGAVMAQTMKVPVSAAPSIRSWDERTGEALAALDRLRLGLVEEAYTFLAGKELPAKARHLASRSVGSYGYDSKRFKANMRKLARELEEVGL